MSKLSTAHGGNDNQNPPDYREQRAIDENVYNNPEAITGREVKEPESSKPAVPPRPEPSDFIYSNTEHVKVDFESVFFEPDDAKLLGPVAVVYKIAYKFTQLGVYNLLAIIFGIFIAVGWGIMLGLFNFCIVWILQPFLRMFLMSMRIMHIFYKTFVRSFLDPFFNAVSLVFSRISGSFGLNVAGITLNSGQRSINNV